MNQVTLTFSLGKAVAPMTFRVLTSVDSTARRLGLRAAAAWAGTY